MDIEKFYNKIKPTLTVFFIIYLLLTPSFLSEISKALKDFSLENSIGYLFFPIVHKIEFQGNDKTEILVKSVDKEQRRGLFLYLIKSADQIYNLRFRSITHTADIENCYTNQEASFFKEDRPGKSKTMFILDKQYNSLQIKNMRMNENLPCFIILEYFSHEGRSILETKSDLEKFRLSDDVNFQPLIMSKNPYFVSKLNLLTQREIRIIETKGFLKCGTLLLPFFMSILSRKFSFKQEDGFVSLF